ncbi:MAG: glycosyltransferase [Candidatus Omnitrophota bacterium]
MLEISLIIPTHGRPGHLKQCLSSVFSQDYPCSEYEVIVVLDGECRQTQEMLSELSGMHSNLRYVVQEKKGPAAARNLGIKLARARIIGLTDDDCVLGSDWIKNMIEAHDISSSHAAISGLTETKGNSAAVLVSQFLANGAMRIKIKGREEMIFFPTCNASYKAAVLKEECFSELFIFPAGEDLEHSWRLFKKGYRFSLRQDIRVLHDRSQGLYAFLKQAYMYGHGNYTVQRIHKDNPLLKEINTRGDISFMLGLMVNFVKIPRFSYILGKRLLSAHMCISQYKKFQIFVFFSLHKIMYILGNISGYIRMNKLGRGPAVETTGSPQQQIPLRPQTIILDLTHRCNLRCNICDIVHDAAINEFSTDEVKGLILQAIEWGVKEFVLSGGEPLMRQDNFAILDFTREKKYSLGILTNGIILDDKFIARLTPYLLCGSVSLNISLDALSPSIHDGIRGRQGCFEKTLKALQEISDLKKKHPQINLNILSIILNNNLQELHALAELAKSLGVNSIQFQPLLANNLIMKERSQTEYWVRPERLEALDQAIDRLILFKKDNPALVRNSERNLGLVKKYFRRQLSNEDVQCLYGEKTMLIANTGDVTTCFDCYGNIRRMPLKEIYLSREARKARKRARACDNPCLLPCFTDY